MKTPCLLVAALAGLVPFVNGQRPEERGTNCFNGRWDTPQKLTDEHYRSVLKNIDDAGEEELKMNNNAEWTLNWFGSEPAVRATLFGNPTKVVKYKQVADAVRGIQRRCGSDGGKFPIGPR
ncbi:hypothetical protein HRG_010499 [Hirsutella rhossiliensis]|uniref:Uncharacterized protein n=1 Tax=Hirsutella rhossiliensis TaxID=111463 RepID=A0A9P8MKX4_9HYPO|nr:uncharacterized protein HRG_10499 [Hirsutella rhossiliensis]KAH0958198.1 hypothetical protein HRG_10499 [Hirsutella rhossiliensis]